MADITVSQMRPQHQQQRQQQQSSSNPSARPEAGAPGSVPGAATLQPESPSQPDPQVLSGSSTVYYNLPFSALDGRQALLAIPGIFLPVLEMPAFDEPAGQQQPQQQSNAPPPSQPGAPPRTQRARMTILAPSSPTYVPLGASPFPFAWLHDVSGWGWPIISLQSPPPGFNLNLPPDPRNAHFLGGPPFPANISFTFAGPGGAMQAEEQPSPERAREFVDSLETADAELRSRMARLGLGELGSFGGDGEEQGELGCPICLDPYDDTADKPEWAGGPDAKDNNVVVIPCPGFHSMHRRCVFEWLSSKPISQWNCPMCRSSIAPSVLVNKDDGGRSGSSASATPAASVLRPPSHDSLVKELAARSHSLREEIHRREKQRGYLCDYPACFPDYDNVGPQAGQEDAFEDDDDETALDRHVITLKPCGHRLHRECLLTTARVQGGLRLLDSVGDEDQDGEDEEGEPSEDSVQEASSCTSRIKVIGKWVECPIDRKEVWAQIPFPQKRRVKARQGSDPAKAESERLCGRVHDLSSSPSHDRYGDPAAMAKCVRRRDADGEDAAAEAATVDQHG